MMVSLWWPRLLLQDSLLFLPLKLSLYDCGYMFGVIVILQNKYEKKAPVPKFWILHSISPKTPVKKLALHSLWRKLRKLLPRTSRPLEVAAPLQLLMSGTNLNRQHAEIRYRNNYLNLITSGWVNYMFGLIFLLSVFILTKLQSLSLSLNKKPFLK